MDMTEISVFGDKLFLVYKDRKGGMKETTLNSSITELFPAIAFEKNISAKLLPDKFYNEIVAAHDPALNVYKNKTASDAGKDTIDRASSSSKFEDKVTNAQAITRFLIEENKRKKINKVVWGYRNNTKPDGVAPNHKGDIFVVFDDGNILGISLKAGSASSAEPQFNSYVRPIFTSFKMLPDFAKLQKTSYKKFYKGMSFEPGRAFVTDSRKGAEAYAKMTAKAENKKLLRRLGIRKKVKPEVVRVTTPKDDLRQAVNRNEFTANVKTIQPSSVAKVRNMSDKEANEFIRRTRKGGDLHTA